MYCGECEQFWKMGGDGGHGVCTVPASYFPTMASAECVYVRKKALTCSLCSHFDNDTACMTAQADDDASSCPGFEDKLEDLFMDILLDWLCRGEYSKEKVLSLCTQFEQSSVFDVVKKALERDAKVVNTDEKQA